MTASEDFIGGHSKVLEATFRGFIDRLVCVFLKTPSQPSDAYTTID
jgi:hypothetical protein